MRALVWNGTNDIRCETVDDLVNFVVARIADHLDVPHNLMKRWGS